MPAPSTSRISQERIILAAESLVATRGLGAVSAREIAKAANLRNNCSVQYHFGSMEGLFQAIVRYRMKQLDGVRTEMMLARPCEPVESNVPHLMECICASHLAIKGIDGSYSYAAFLCQYLPVFHPTGFEWLMQTEDASMPALRRLIDALRRCFPTLPPDIFDRRITSATLLFLNTLQGLGKAPVPHRGTEDEAILADAIVQSVAVLKAPFGLPASSNLQASCSP